MEAPGSKQTESVQQLPRRALERARQQTEDTTLISKAELPQARGPAYYSSCARACAEFAHSSHPHDPCIVKKTPAVPYGVCRVLSANRALHASTCCAAASDPSSAVMGRLTCRRRTHVPALRCTWGAIPAPVFFEIRACWTGCSLVRRVSVYGHCKRDFGNLWVRWVGTHAKIACQKLVCGPRCAGARMVFSAKAKPLQVVQ